MIYFSPSTRKLPLRWGIIATPQRRVADPGVVWCADNGQFTGKATVGDYMEWLPRMLPWLPGCVFASVPDVVGDAVATLEKYRYYAWRIKALGYPVALVAQDGLESLRWPPEYDALFVGGTTGWKMSEAADWCIHQAKRAGKWVHVGRVNSVRRIRHFQLVGVDSVDGTSITYEPDAVMRLLSRGINQMPLFTLEGLCT